MKERRHDEVDERGRGARGDQGACGGVLSRIQGEERTFQRGRPHHVCGARVRRGRDVRADGCDARLLAHDGPFFGRVREEVRRVDRREARASCEQRFFGEPDRFFRPDRAGARRASDPPRRRGHHRGVRIPHDGDAHPAVRCGSRVCGRDGAAVQHRRDEARSRAQREDESRYDRAHAGQSVRPLGREGILRQVQPLARRGQLRRAGHAVHHRRRDEVHRHMGRYRHVELLSAAPHDDGRGRMRLHQ